MSSAPKVIFLDRDGVINRRAPEGLYITSVSEFRVLPGVFEAIARLNRHGFIVFVTTNQRCIARGIVPGEVVQDIHEHLRRNVEAAGGMITKVYVCPHDYADACDCRKLKPGMLRQAMHDYSLDLRNSWMIGDSASDIEAGKQAGCRTVYIGNSASEESDATAASLTEAADVILRKA